jgi:putative phage-type endonuclease
MSSKIANKLYERELNGEFLKQQTSEWLAARAEILTASECASALECNIYQSAHELLLNKLNKQVFNNDATNWGNTFEPIVKQFYETTNNIMVCDIGLIRHPVHKWLGASPDGLILTGKLLEIKCPISRKITDEVMLPHWIQIQIQLEVCDLDICEYLECEFYTYENKSAYDADIDNGKDPIKPKGIIESSLYSSKPIYWCLKRVSMKKIIRDKKWFIDNMPKLKRFNDQITYYKKAGLKTLKQHMKQNHIIKRKNPNDSYLSNPNDSYTSNMATNLIDWKKWVSATKTRNSMLNDPLLDWLDYHGYSSKHGNNKINDYKPIVKDTNSVFTNFIMNKGNDFEKMIIKNIQHMYGNSVVTIANKYQIYSNDKYNETVQHMIKGTPIIISGILHNHSNNTYGMPDIIIRSDWVNKLINKHPLNDKDSYKKAPNLDKYHYCVIDIKYTTLKLCANGINMLNDKQPLAYKSQLYIYNKALGNIQGYIPKKAFIIGRRCTYKQHGAIHTSANPFDQVGVINFKTFDAGVRIATAAAVTWIRDVRFKGSKWKLNPPSNDNLRPNMCNQMDNPWHSVKEHLAKETDEITLLWMCGIKNREIGLSNGINNWRTQNTRAKNLGITSDITCNTLQLIIDYNNDTVKQKPFLPIDELPLEYRIHPMKITNNLYKWKKQSTQAVDFYIDFETVGGAIFTHETDTTSIVFMIGVGYEYQGSWVYKNFCVNSITSSEEVNMIRDVHTYILEILKLHKTSDKPRYFHWGNAEVYLYKSLITRYRIKPIINNWCDLLRVFKEEPIVVRGALNFGLKSIAKAFYDNGFIEHIWQPSVINNGLNAMIYAIQANKECVSTKTSMTNNKIVKEIIDYNEIDVVVMYDIITYLRNNNQ